MPTYEYRCKDCGHEFEAVQSFTDDALTECPSCQGALRKVFGNVGITFKGSGFYKTDSRSGGSTAPKTADAGASSSSDKSESKSDSSSSSDKSTSTPTTDKSSTKSDKKPATKSA